MTNRPCIYCGRLTRLTARPRTGKGILSWLRYKFGAMHPTCEPCLTHMLRGWTQ